MSTDVTTLTIVARGEIVSSNFAEFAERVRARLTEINRDLKTDDDFVQADTDAKGIESAENALKTAKEKALADAQQLHDLFTQIDGLSGELSAARLDLTKQIAKRKAEVKEEIITSAREKLECAPRLREPIYGVTLANAIKGKRTLDTMRKALDMAVTIANGQIKKCREILDQFEGEHGKDMILDREDLEVKRPDQVEGELRRRLDVKRADDQRKQAEAEAQKAREAAAEAQQKLKESQAPPAPPKPRVNPSRSVFPMPGEEVLPEVASDASQEWETFLSLCRNSFAPLKGGREALKNPGNIEKAAKFALAINAAWKEATA